MMSLLCICLFVGCAFWAFLAYQLTGCEWAAGLVFIFCILQGFYGWSRIKTYD